MAEQFSFTFNGAHLKAIVNAYRQLADEFVFHFTRADIRTSMISTDGSRLIQIVLTPDYYSAYQEEAWVRGGMGMLWGAVKKLKKAETVTVRVEGDKLYVGTFQVGDVVPEEEIDEVERHKPPEAVEIGFIQVDTVGFKRVLRNAPPDTRYVGFDIDEPGGHIVLGESVVDLGEPHEWLFGVSGKAREAYDIKLFIPLLVSGLIEDVYIRITDKGPAIIEYAEVESTVKIYMAPMTNGADMIAGIVERPKPVRTLILRMGGIESAALGKAVKAIDYLTEYDVVTFDTADGLGLFWEVGYLKVPSHYLGEWIPPPAPIQGGFNLKDLVKHLKGVEDLRLYYDAENRLVLWGAGPTRAPGELTAIPPGVKVEVPTVEGKDIFRGPVDLLLRTVDDARAAEDEYLVFYTTPYEIEAFGRNAVYYEATFELDSFQAVEEDYIPIGGDAFGPLIGFFKNVPAEWCSVGKTLDEHVYLSCETDIGELRAIRTTYETKEAIKAYEEKVKRPVAPPEAEKLPEAPKPKYPEYLRIPYGIESLVGARTPYLEVILPDWNLVGTLGPLIRPDGRVSMHAHFTEITEDMAAHREALMEALKKIHEIFRALGVEQIMSSAALEPFKEKTSIYVIMLNRPPPGEPTVEDVMLGYEMLSEPVARSSLERVLETRHFGYTAIRDTIDKMMRAGKFIEHPIRGAGFLDVPKPPPVKLEVTIPSGSVLPTGSMRIFYDMDGAFFKLGYDVSAYGVHADVREAVRLSFSMLVTAWNKAIDLGYSPRYLGKNWEDSGKLLMNAIYAEAKPKDEWEKGRGVPYSFSIDEMTVNVGAFIPGKKLADLSPYTSEIPKEYISDIVPNLETPPKIMIPLPPPKLLDPAKAVVAEVRTVTRGAFRFVLLNDGTISVASMGKFLGKEELEARPELLKEAQGYFLEELETLGIKPPAFEPVTVYPSTHINQFTGVDKKLYGPFEAGEAALIPRENAELFVKEHFASWEKLPPKPPEVPPPAVRTYAELVKGFEEKDPWDALAIFVSRFEGFQRDYSTEDLHRFLRELRERTSTESVYRFYKIYPHLKDDFVSIASRIGWIPPAPPVPAPPKPRPPRRPPPARLRPEEVEDVWEQFLGFAGAVGIEATLATTYRDRFMETIRTSPTVANAIERARRLISSIQRAFRPAPPTAPPMPRIAPAEEDVAEVYRRLGVPPGAKVSEEVFQTVWQAIQREKGVGPPKGLIRSELDYLWREFADFLKKFDMDPERYRPEFDAVINPDFNLVENLDTVMKKVHELTDGTRWGPERWR